MADLLVVIHIDVCSPISVVRAVDFSIFSDDLSRYVNIYLMRHKSGTFEKFKEFQNEVEDYCNKKIMFLQ